MRNLIVAIHDVAPSTLAEAGMLRALVRSVIPGPVSLLVVPRMGGQEVWTQKSLDAFHRWACGDEIVLHGYSHRGASDERELAACSEDEALARIATGRVELTTLGLPVRGFVAPCYAHTRATEAACRRSGLDWWATRGRLTWHHGSRPLPSLGVGASTRTKRIVSPIATPALAIALTPAPDVRLDLHPADLAHVPLLRAGMRLLSLFLEQGRALATHEDLVRARPRSGDPAPVPRRATLGMA